MFGVYLFCAVLGGGLVLFSLLGGGEHHGGHDVDLHHGGDLGGHHAGAGELLLGFFQLRNMTFLLAVFGVTGLLGHWLGIGPLVTALLATGMGLFSSVLVHGVFTWLRRSDSAVDVLTDSDLEGTFARVVLPLAPGARGQVSSVLSGRQLYLTARLSDDVTEALPAGSAVVILRMRAGVAEVAPAPNLELSSSVD